MLLSIWMIPPVSFAQGQKKYTVEGKVTLYGTNEPIPYVNVLIKELNVWGSSDANGVFKISGIIPGTYTLEATSLGYQKFALPVTITKDVPDFKVQLKEENLTLSDVVVTAKAGNSLNSSSKVEKAAIDHVQASSLADIMQLIPGTIIQNPNLTSINKITIRSISDLENNNERGVSLMINGSKVSTDASMTIKEPDSDLSNQIDYRNYSTNNIESIEVLKGVLSAEYGDVTSGAILVTTKAGRSPFEVRVKSDPKTKAFSLSKGFSIGPKAGNINIDADYARAFKNWISPVDIFDRTTLGITYSNTFNADKKPFRFNARLSGFISGNDVTSDPDVSKLDFTKTTDKSLSLSIYGSWFLNKSWITSLNYNISGTYERDYNQTFTVKNDLSLPTTSTLIEGISLGTFTRTLNEKDYRSEEIPIYANAKVSGSLNKKINKVLTKTLLGVEWNTKGNVGRGVYYKGEAPQYFRERNYKDIPFMTDLSLFLEEKVNIPVVAKTSLELSAGVRFNQMLIDGYDYDPTFDPRFNGKYTVIPSRRDGVIRSLAFRGGWGILQRLPSIVHLYPDPRYIDNPLFQYKNTTTNEQLAVIQTSIIDDKLTYNLKPAKTKNAEIGVDFNILGVEAQLTYFRERLSDGITDNANYVSESYDYYNSVSDPNAAPKYENGRVWVKNSSGEYVQLGYITNKEFKLYSKPDNRGTMKKWGIEYDLDFGKIKSINTSVIVTGAYIWSENSTPGLMYNNTNYIDPINSKERLPYVGIYEGDYKMTFGTGAERLSTNISFVTHIPSIRMIVSLSTQCIWLQNSWNIYDEGNIYTLNANGEPVYGDYNNKNNLSVLYRDPVAYMDHNGVVRPFSDYYTTTDQDLKTRLNLLRKSTDQSYYFKETGYNPYFMANIRITKEIRDIATLSFYANNFTNSTPKLKNKARQNDVGRRMNTPIYFGAELKITF
ncbi:MAG: TonB-dependent receptor [Rikenellaceae bacterium]